MSGEPIEDWIEQAWQRILALGLIKEPPAKASWGNLLALTGLRIASPYMMNWFRRWNERSGEEGAYTGSVKPYNQFIHARLLPGQVGKDERITLVAPVGTDVRSSSKYANIHDPARNEIRVIPRKSTHPDMNTLFGQTYDDLMDEHGKSSESKFRTSSGGKVTGKTRGLLQRAHIQVGRILHIGKEANDFEKVQAGLVDRMEEVQTIYEQDRWEELWLIVREMPVDEIMEISGYRKRMAYSIKKGERKPSSAKMRQLKQTVLQLEKPH